MNTTPRKLACGLFVGAGGMDEGISQTGGFEVVVANEYDPQAAKTYALNHPQTKLVIADLTLKSTKDQICACFSEKPCDLLIGGVPCQSFSHAGKQRGFKDPRGRLWFDFLEMCRRLKPAICLAENVPGLLKHKDALETILSIFNHLGYYAEYKVLNASSFGGVPQERKRLFFIASRIGGPIIWSVPQRGEP